MLEQFKTLGVMTTIGRLAEPGGQMPDSHIPYPDLNPTSSSLPSLLRWYLAQVDRRTVRRNNNTSIASTYLHWGSTIFNILVTSVFRSTGHHIRVQTAIRKRQPLKWVTPADVIISANQSGHSHCPQRTNEIVWLQKAENSRYYSVQTLLTSL